MRGGPPEWLTTSLYTDDAQAPVDAVVNTPIGFLSQTWELLLVWR